MMKRKQKYDTPIRIICALLFATFSFLYIYMFQGELLALVQDHLSQGLTTNNTLVTASLITLLLMVLQYLLNIWSKLHGSYEACSYLPSCVVLALITKVDSTFSYSWVLWLVALAVVAVVAVVYLLIVWINRNTFQAREVTFIKLLTPNLAVVTVLFMFVGWYGNNHPAETMELAAWKYTHRGEYDKVLAVGQRSVDCNANLTALRNLALVKTGQSGDRLFAYPQPYGSDGLLMNKYKMQTLEYGSKAYYSLLGNTPYGGEKATAFYKRMMQQYGDSVHYRDLYAAALLLDKDLETFAALTAGEGQSLSDASVHTQEAWMIYNELYPFSPIPFTPDNVVKQRYQEYIALREAHADNPIAMQNLCKRRFGDSYWYYYDFVK